LAATGFGFTIGSAAAQSQLNIICSVQLPWCEAVITQFQKDTAIKIGMTQKSAGER
jgi:iron(III) transport system substrate-binding protein